MRCASLANILVVDDEPRMLTAVRTVLLQDGHSVQVAMDGESGLRLASKEGVNLVILDVVLPKMDGLEVCRAVRRQSSVPILMLTARGEELDRVLGLELGADDYLSKPFSMRELQARVKALLRRSSGGFAVQGATRSLVSGSLAVDLISRKVTCDGKPLHLTPREFDLMACLMSAPGRVFTREELLKQVWGYGGLDTTRTLTVHMGGLRKKLDAVPTGRELIQTVRGGGYRLRES